MGKLAKAQSQRAKKQPRHKDGRFKTDRRARLLSDTKSGGHSDGIVTIEYKKRKVEVGGKNYYIPVDDSGHVPRTALAARLQDVNEGSRRGRRNVIRDLSSDANTVIKGDKLTPEEVANWWAYPNESDIDEIDTTKDWKSLSGYSRKKYNSARSIVLLNVDKKTDSEIRRVLMDSFTKGELDKMAGQDGVTVVISKDIDGAGAYDPMNKTIYLRPEYSDAAGTITHEFTHHLRLKDKKRTGDVTRSQIKSGAITSEELSLEEAATTAETVARVTPYKGVRNLSYYWVTGANKKTAQAQMDHDRDLFVGSMEKNSRGLRGKRAVTSVEKNFDESEISKLSLKKTGR